MRSTSLLVPPTVIESSDAMSYTRQDDHLSTTCMGSKRESGRSKSERRRPSTAFHSSVSKRTSSSNNSASFTAATFRMLTAFVRRCVLIPVRIAGFDAYAIRFHGTKFFGMLVVEPEVSSKPGDGIAEQVNAFS